MLELQFKKGQELYEVIYEGNAEQLMIKKLERWQFKRAWQTTMKLLKELPNKLRGGEG